MAQAFWYSDYSYFYFYMNADVAGDGKTVNWSLYVHYSRLTIGSGNTWSVNVGGNQYSGEIPVIWVDYSGSHETLIASGSTYFEHTAAMEVGFSFYCWFNGGWHITNKWYYEASGSSSVWLPQLAVDPTPPNSVSVSGGSSGWLNKDSPLFNVSWSGASAGTATIYGYSIDVSKDNWGNSTNVGYVETGNTYGSANNVSASAVGLNGGETIRIRVGINSSYGWKGHGYWGGTFKVYSRPSAPSTFNVPANQEIDTSFNITWSGASAGSNGIAGYDLEIRAYNGSSWTDWVRLWNCVNKTSYPSGSPKSLSVNGVSYANYGESVKFQYRIRTSDGIIATSDWVTKTMNILINKPTVPRKQKCFCNKDETKY